MITLSTFNWKIENIKAVFFDKDGTLVNSHVYWGRIIEKRSQALIETFRLDGFLHETFCDLMGYSLKNKRLKSKGPIALLSREKVINILYNYFRENDISISEAGMVELFIKVHHDFMSEIHNYVKILPGAKDFLIALKEKNIKTAVITTDSIKNTKESIKFLGLDSFFDLLIGKEETPEPKVSGKPAIIALEKLGLNSEDTVCIGDAPMDIIMSNKANLKAGIGVVLGQISFEKLKQYTKYVFKNYDEIIIK